MYKRIALTAIIALAALTGCTQGETTEPVAHTTQDAEPAVAKATCTETTTPYNVWEVQDSDTWAKYEFDFTTPYSDDLTEATDEIFEKAGADEGEWYKVT